MTFSLPHEPIFSRRTILLKHAHFRVNLLQQQLRILSLLQSTDVIVVEAVDELIDVFGLSFSLVCIFLLSHGVPHFHFLLELLPGLVERYLYLRIRYL